MSKKKHPHSEVFHELREIWLYGEGRHEANPTPKDGRTSLVLAEKLGTTKQVISCWAGIADRNPSLKSLLQMARLVNAELRYHPSGAIIISEARTRHGQPQTKATDCVIDGEEVWASYSK